MNFYKKRIEEIRKLMKQNKIDAYVIPTEDYHNSEYPSNFFKCREYISGFSGSAGTIILLENFAGLWTDGRYYIQALDQLKGSTITLCKEGQSEVPTIFEFLEKTLIEGSNIGFDGRVITAKFGLELQNIAKKKRGSIIANKDLVGKIWGNRPKLPANPAYFLDEKTTGKSRLEKLSNVRKIMENEGADFHIISNLADIGWLLNIRGNDVEFNPVVLSYLILTKTCAILYVQQNVINQSMECILKNENIKVANYEDFYEELISLNGSAKVLLQISDISYSVLYNLNENIKIIDKNNPTSYMKAIKNEVEIENIKYAHVKDDIAVTKFIYWLKHNIGKIKITEISAANYLEDKRKEQEGFIENSFSTISGFGIHGAIIHYEPKPETDLELKPYGFLLVDSGGQYTDGTTDVTRTIALGDLNSEEKKAYTAVLKGMLELASAEFPYGYTGVELDSFARKPIQEIGLDFNHGTGHGVGYILNVHEGPNRISPKILDIDKCIFEPGMITSDEPGAYIEGKFGIRIENLILCKETKPNEKGRVLCFEHLTYVPIDTEAIDMLMMTDIDKNRLNCYHKNVYEKISPYLDQNEKIWLKDITQEI